MSPKIISLTVGLFILIHLGVLPQVLDTGTNLVLFCGHLFFFACGIFYAKKLNNFRWVNYLLGYFLLAFVLFLFARRYLIFVISLFVYAAVFHRPRLLGGLFIFLFSILVVTAYWVQAFIIITLFYIIALEVFRREENAFYSYIFGLGFLLLILILFPLLYLLFQSAPQTLLATFNPAFKQALANSLITSSVSTAVILILGVPLGYFLAKTDFRSKPLVNALVDLPILVPQTTVGIAILVFLGPKAPLGGFFERSLGVTFSGSYLAIVACQIFVSTPFLVRAAQNSFEEVNPKLENISRNLGASPFKTFLTVSLPLAAPGIFNGALLSFSRALSEAGSLMVIAYRPATIPIYAHDIFLQYGVKEAIPVTILFLLILLWVFIVLKWIYEYRKKKILSI